MNVRTVVSTIALAPALLLAWLFWPAGVVDTLIIFGFGYAMSWVAVSIVAWTLGLFADLFRAYT